MKKNIIVVLLLLTSVTIQAQYSIRSQIVLPVLELKDKQFLGQLDSALFVNYPCFGFERKQREQYVYFVNVKGDTLKNYTIDIIYARPSETENDVNTGIYRINENKTLIIREESHYPLFTETGGKEQFMYKKELMKGGYNDRDLIEIKGPEEFCTWGLYYSDHQLKVEYPEKQKPLPPPNERIPSWK